MSRRLKGLLAEHNIQHQELAKVLGLTRETLSHKLNGKSDWWLGEMAQIKNYFKQQGIEISYDEVFATAEELTTTRT